MISAMCYVDQFAGDLAGLGEKFPYLTELGTMDELADLATGPNRKSHIVDMIFCRTLSAA
jgi:hypothetical protein